LHPPIGPHRVVAIGGHYMVNSSGTVIGKGICIRGEVSGEEDFFLDGVLEGNITLTGKRLTVGANGVIHADIVAGDLVVFGRVEGSVKASGRAELKHSAVFVGDISATRLSIEDNATLQGYVDLTDGAQPPKKEPVAQNAPEAEESAEYVEQFSEAV
jgi:cytoskeletal protein CcmA (bactofilin family)